MGNESKNSNVSVNDLPEEVRNRIAAMVSFIANNIPKVTPTEETAHLRKRYQNRSKYYSNGEPRYDRVGEKLLAEATSRILKNEIERLNKEKQEEKEGNKNSEE